MDIIRPATPFSQLVAGNFQDTFMLIDIGCSGGIHTTWGTQLRAFGFDPNLAEIERLKAAETLPGVEYIAAFIGPRADDPAMRLTRLSTYWERNPWARLAIARTPRRALGAEPCRATHFICETPRRQNKRIGWQRSKRRN